MPFGLDIPGLIADAHARRGGLDEATLHVVTAGSRGADPTAGTTPTEADKAARGILDDFTDREIDGTLVVAGDRRVILLAATIEDDAVPSPNDRLTIGGVKYEIVRVMRPAGASNYVCQVRA